MKKRITILLIFCFYFQAFRASSQNNYFIDGYHGGIWGHYPARYTEFMSGLLDKNPFWKINIEIEPETWDNVKLTDADGYNRFQQLVKDQSTGGRVEFVNPAYGQSYLFNIQGESVIRQLELGIRKIREHFPEATFTTYSSEEPCFTSALPQILKSFGYKYASLKNPNTCWGGYTTAYGGELVNWTGPDGSKLLTVPRYGTESLLNGSTWQTIAWNNSKDYLRGARSQGIQNPIGMCLQDAGWKNGPWLGQPKNFEYQTWRNYIANVADKKQVPDWKFTQENVQVSLVWGAQILQKLAQNVRAAENKLIMAEKLNVLQSVYLKKPIKGDLFKDAWQNLLLAQHHDSWIVPYNIVDKVNRLNWAEQVKVWTDKSVESADRILRENSSSGNNGQQDKRKVYNTLAINRREPVLFTYNESYTEPVIIDATDREVTTQQITGNNGQKQLLFMAEVPSMGFASYRIKERSSKAKTRTGATASLENSNYRIQTDLYDILVDTEKGGTITSLIAKKLHNKQFVDKALADKYFNEMKGYFYTDSAWHSSADHRANITLLENGPLRVKLKIEGLIGIHPFSQVLTLAQGDPKIDIQTRIDWQGNPGIGQDFNQKGKWKAEELKKAFYNDRYKLSALFPVNLKQQKVYKNAPFDVLQSKLKDTYFNTWDSIKNNLIVNWVDVTQDSDETGMALLTDHTTSYSHGEDGTLGLTMQYSGMGLWGRNYSIKGPSEIRYALLPHAGKWDKADLWSQNLKWNEALQIKDDRSALPATASLIDLSALGYEVSSLQTEDNALLFRLFNASGKHGPLTVTIDIPGIKEAQLVALNGVKIEQIHLKKQKQGKQTFSLSIPEFGLRTVKLLMESK
ncbi:MAG TPA: glycoside hydrolase family 38 C-terminal domain-containing protein [Pedobacter sp.]|uniref:glycoside hydrolase family 38 C-terminal domain-containing protein n=1 Tax=Pedobacter sp. TaxID=1411316 RepID=UPI002CC41364|nr:glycoside hydrolase family 38 C-terminal domain-containing protein [Pedobacter sp.]HMI03671.1 glycoside hydrolase family 38 C-terminal domain-containing protein [Pedobacter sp.]